MYSHLKTFELALDSEAKNSPQRFNGLRTTSPTVGLCIVNSIHTAWVQLKYCVTCMKAI